MWQIKRVENDAKLTVILGVGKFPAIKRKVSAVSVACHNVSPYAWLLGMSQPKEMEERLLMCVGLKTKGEEPFLQRLVHIGKLLAFLTVASKPQQRVTQSSCEQCEIRCQSENVD